MDITHDDYCEVEGCTGECIDAERERALEYMGHRTPAVCAGECNAHGV